MQARLSDPDNRALTTSVCFCSDRLQTAVHPLFLADSEPLSSWCTEGLNPENAGAHKIVKEHRYEYP
jgi:hypothetical protein